MYCLKFELMSYTKLECQGQAGMQLILPPVLSIYDSHELLIAIYGHLLADIDFVMTLKIHIAEPYYFLMFAYFLKILLGVKKKFFLS